ncbi:COP1-interactive protein 1 [Varanus komodoensis]|uniref:COP1-interactive protein 1 n=1 Tax=Varanus komodoensis TaxID=61221 RepID=UPI001CF7DB3A|nr:COP1-interactive protein 1 [Varanus komodoensis]
MKEDLAKAQANVQSLEEEKKMLEEKLKRALEEAEMAKGQLAEIPPHIPDWRMTYTAIEEDDKDVPKKGKKGIKVKGKGEDRTDLKQQSSSGTDRSIHKQQKTEMGKAGESFPRKSQDLSTVPPIKDAKHKRKGSAYPDGHSDTYEKELSKQTTQSEGTSRIADKKMEDSKKMKAKTEGKSETVDSKGVAKSKEPAETKKTRSTIKGIGKETPLEPPTLSHIQEEQELSDSTKEKKKTMSETLDKSPEKMLPPDSKRRKKEITTSPESIIEEKGESLYVHEQKPSPPLAKFEVEDSAEPIKPTEEMERISATTTPEKPLILEKGLSKIHIDAVEPGEDEIKDLLNEKMLQLADHLTDLEEMPEAETLAKLLLEPGQGLRKIEKERKEKKRSLFANLTTTLQILQEIPSVEAVLSDREINKLSEKRTLLLANLESNMKDLEQAQALAVTQPSEMSENKVKELLQQRELLEANLEANMQELQRTKTLEVGLPEKYMHDKEHTFELNEQRQHLFSDLTATLGDLEEKQRRGSERAAFVRLNEQELYELYGLSGKKQELLEKLESNQKELQEAQALSASQPGSVIEREVYELSVKKAELLDKLESNKKELQEAQALAIAQPGIISDYKLQKLIEERRGLATDLEKTTQKLQKAQDLALEGHALSQPSERTLYELSEKKQELLGKLKTNQKELQEAQELGAMHPGAISEQKLQELAEQRRYLTEELEGMEHDILEAECRASERAVIGKPSEKELYELMVTKQVLQKKLKSNQKELEEAQFLAAMHPGSISEHKLQELAEQRKYLSDDLKTTVSNIQKASKKSLLESVERELYELSEKKQAIEASLESNWKELQKLQDLVATQPDSITELKLQELTEERRFLTEDLEATMHDIQKAERRVSEATKAEQTIEKELYELSEKKQLLLENLKDLQEAQALAATQRGSVGDFRRKQLDEQRRHLAEDLEATVHDIQKLQHLAPEIPVTVKPSERELFELSEKKYLLLENLASNRKELQEAQALAAAQPGSVSDSKLQEIAEQRRRLTEDLKATLHNIQEMQRRPSLAALTGRSRERELYELSEKKQMLLKVLESKRNELKEAEALAAAQPGSISEKELYELSAKKQILLESLESKKKELQEAEILAVTHPGIISEHKLQELDEQRRHLTTELEATVHNIQNILDRASPRTLTGRAGERELYELSEKKQMLLESLESKKKELQEAEALAAAQPGSISERKLQELDEQRRHLTTELEATVHDMQEIQHRASPGTLTRSSDGKGLHELSLWKQFLLESLESNVKLLDDAHALEATQPGSISEKKMKELNEQRRILTEDLKAVVQDVQEMKLSISEAGGKFRPISMDLNELYRKKKWVLECLELNRKHLRAAQTLAATHPISINEQKVQELTEQRRLLAAGLDAIIQDLHDIVSFAPEKIGSKSRERILEELSEKKKQFLENLASNLKALKEAQALAAVQHNDVNEQKVQELIEKRRLLTAGLQTIMKEMKQLQDLLSTRLEIPTPSERELAKLSEKRRLVWENMEKNVEELKALQAIVNNLSGSTNQQKMKELAEKRTLLTTYLETVLQDIQSFDSDKYVMTRLDEAIQEVSDDHHPLGLLKSEAAALSAKYGSDDEKIAKQRVLAAKLEANIKDLQTAFEIQKIEKPKYMEKEIELALKRQFMQPLPGNYYQQSTVNQPSFPLLVSPIQREVNANKLPSK